MSIHKFNTNGKQWKEEKQQTNKQDACIKVDLC